MLRNVFGPNEQPKPDSRNAKQLRALIFGIVGEGLRYSVFAWFLHVFL